MLTSPIIVAYDGSPNADDAVVLGNLLANLTDAPLALAHVFRAPSQSPRDGTSAIQGRAEVTNRVVDDLLSHGARLADRDVARLALGSTTTASGIRTIVERERAALVLFGSAQRTLPERVHPGSASRRLLHGLPCALGFAPVSFRHRGKGALEAVAVAHDDPAYAAQRSAEALARAAGAAVAEGEHGGDLLFVGSAPGGQRGQVLVNATVDRLIQTALAPVVVVPYGEALQLAPAAATVAA